MAEEAFAKGNELFVDDEFHQAEQYFKKAVEGDSKNPKYLLHRATTLLKLKKYKEAIGDLDDSIKIHETPNAQLRKGIAHFYLDQYEEAKSAFLKAQDLGIKNQEINLWLRKCSAELKREEKKNPKPQKSTSSSSSSSSSSTTTTFSSSSTTSSKTATSNQTNQSTPSSVTASAPPVVTAASVRPDWFQDSTSVSITLFVKNLEKKNVTVNFQQQKISVKLNLPDGSVYDKELYLYGIIDPKHPSTTFTVTKYKVEITLQKVSSGDWKSLEGSPDDARVVDAIVEEPAAGPIRKPYSMKKERDFEALEVEVQKEEENEKPEGDAALQKLFQSIYKDGDENLRKAMNKSYQLSGGTVLSTDWKEVAKQDYTKKSPPQGQEFRSWNE